MRPQAIAALSALAGVHGIRILQSNDDGWAELYIRSLHEELGRAGHDVVLSAPAENKSGAGKTSPPPSRSPGHLAAILTVSRQGPLTRNPSRGQSPASMTAVRPTAVLSEVTRPTRG